MTITLQVSERTEEILKSAAKQRGVDVSTFVEGLVLDYSATKLKYLALESTHTPETLAVSLAELVEEANNLERGQPIVSDDPNEQLFAQGIVDKFAKQGFRS